MANVLDGQDLILSVGEKALGYSTGCKVTTNTETGERQTKEASAGKWKEKYVKSFSEQITANGVVLKDSTSDLPSYEELKAMQLAGAPVTASYSVREGDTREGKTAGCWSGSYLITSLELDAQAGDDAKYALTLENCGPVTKTGNGIKGTTGV